MDQRIPPEVQPIAQDFSSSLQRELPDLIDALYLEGSIALDSFNPKLSDIDFAAILSSKATPNEIDIIHNIHKSIGKRSPAWKISGWYYQPGNLQGNDNPREPILYCHNGKLNWSTQFGLSLVTWWILNNCGVTLFGPPAQRHGVTVNMDDLLITQLENLNTYWTRWPKRPGRFLALFSGWGIQWLVLGILRQFYTLREHKITSKDKAGAYALAHLPMERHKIIREALALRASPQRTLYLSRIQRAAEALQFHRYIIPLCNDIAIETLHAAQ